MQPVIRVARGNYERIKTLDIVWTEDDIPNEGILLPSDPKYRLIRDFPSGRYRYEETKTFTDGRKDAGPDIEAFDGIVRTAYPWRDYNGPPFSAPGYVKRISSPSADIELQATGPGASCSAYAPVEFPFPPGFFKYLAECKVRSGPAMEGGFTRVVADHFSSGKIDGQIWLDMDRGALPVQEITFCKEEPSALGPLMVEPNLPAPGVESEYWITEVHQFKDSKGLSVWLPTKMKQSDTNGTSTQEVNIAKTKLNPEIDPHLFRMKFPIGASVFNPATGSFFTTDPNDPSLDYTLPLPRPSTLPINVTK